MKDFAKTDSAAPIVLDGVGKTFPGAGAPAVRGVDLALAPGSFTCLLGPSGCGKTTVLRMAAGLLAPGEGTVRVGGGPPRPGAGIGVVFQNYRLLPWLRVIDNVAFPLRLAGVAKAERRSRARRMLDRVGLAEAARAWPAQLSGGMQQRASLARALVGRPSVLLLDEPFASVDAQTRELMQIELMRLCAGTDLTVLFVTHSIEEAILLGDRVVLMGGRPGRVLESTAVPLPRPRDPVADREQGDFVALAGYLRRRMRDLVMNDPQSGFRDRL